jgi:hypothetical protein
MFRLKINMFRLQMNMQLILLDVLREEHVFILKHTS